MRSQKETFYTKHHPEREDVFEGDPSEGLGWSAMDSSFNGRPMGSTSRDNSKNSLIVESNGAYHSSTPSFQLFLVLGLLLFVSTNSLHRVAS